MGAFFLHPTDTVISKDELISVYRKKGFSDPSFFVLGDYCLYLFRKQLISNDNFYIDSDYSIFAVGSFFYKNQNYENSLKQILGDFQCGRLDSNSLNGNFFVIIYNKSESELSVFIDPAFIKNIYFSLTEKIISTDFLGIVYASLSPLSWNKMAIIENIVTGNLIPPDTYINEINRMDASNYSKLSSSFHDINFILLKPKLEDSPKSRDEAIEKAGLLLNSYFAGAEKLCDSTGSHVGLTGGFDSRLLLVYAKKNIANLVTNSFWRPNSTEFKIAQDLATKAEIKFNFIKDNDFPDYSLEEKINRNFYFHDGQIRSQNRWDQIYNHPEYTHIIANEHFVGFHGSGGEQYRNADRFTGRLKFKTFVDYQWILKQTRNPFLSKKNFDLLSELVQYKISRLIGNNKYIDLLLLKRIQNEVWNTANRTIRLNYLNQQQFYFAPFTEFMIAHNAYNYVPYLGSRLSFQTSMMNRTDAQLSMVNTTYGYNLVKGEPFKNRILPVIIKALNPKLTSQLFHYLRKTQQNHGDFKLPPDYDSTPLIKSLQEVLDFNIIHSNVNLSSGLNSMLYLVSKLNNRVEH